MNILLTGSTGFIGSHFMNKYNKKFNVIHGLSNNKKNQKTSTIELFQKNKLEKLFQKNKYDIVIHLGTTSKEKTRDKMLKENCDTTENLLDCCVANNVKKIIFISAGIVYGNTKYLPIDENHPKKPTTNYAYSKMINEKKCEAYRKKYDIEVIILRISSVYGPGQLQKFVIPTLIKNAIQNDSIMLHEYKNGFQLMDYIHVDDVCDGIIASCKNNAKSGIYNIASGKPITAKDIVKILKKILKIKTITIKKFKSNTEHYFYDVNLAKKELNFIAKKKINEKTIKEIIHFYNFNP